MRSAYKLEWVKTNRERVRAYAKKWAKANPEKVRAYNKKWRKDNKEKELATRKKYREDNVGKLRAYNSKREAAKLKRTPSWADLDAISFFYECCPKGCHVDHIIPLQGDNI